MNSILICLFVLSNILVCIKPEEITYMASYCPNTTSDYAQGSKFQFNLNRLLYRLLYNNASNSIYAKPSVGENDDDRVHGLYLCRGDVAPKDCQNCIDVASERIQRECPLKKQATILYDQCLIRYSSIPNFASTFNVSSYYWIVYNSDQSFSWMKQVKGISDAMFDNLTPKATNDLKYAESFDEITPLSLSQKLYGMVQCIPDLSAEDCRACLKGARSVIPKSVPRECRVVHESCHLSYQFKNPEEGRTGAPPPPSPTSGGKDEGGMGAPPPPSPTPGDKDQGEITWKTKLICMVTCVIALLAVVLAGSCIYLKKRRTTERERRERRQLIKLLDMEGNLLDEF
ncbi:putative cysteine-rich receptor-like protein kinase 9 isoform X3 [Solanum stenotomum]|uniref:putative cysteine-rich receptor-like protein kinase 9 isoform X3 n=1 Tax=Solanum stenotomum TaxID=172797 RepID=UPI0020D16622|nr:putative cysteine-rich receptor-like protein kinase 9 isoform X3 [Solanum stenotomum]